MLLMLILGLSEYLKLIFTKLYKPAHDNTNKMACAPSKDQPGHPPSLIRVFAVHMKKAWVLSYLLSTQQRLWSDWADAQADLSLHWAHMPFCWFCRALAQIWASLWENIPSDICTQPRLKSACTCVESDQSSMSTWINFASLTSQDAHSKYSDQLIWIFAGCTFPKEHFLMLSLALLNKLRCHAHF